MIGVVRAALIAADFTGVAKVRVQRWHCQTPRAFGLGLPPGLLTCQTTAFYCTWSGCIADAIHDTTHGRTAASEIRGARMRVARWARAVMDFS